MKLNTKTFKTVPPGLLALGLALSFNAAAGDLTIPNTFTANTPALAAEVNQNFNAVKTEVDDNDARLDTLEALIISMQSTINNQQAAIAQLQSDLTAVQSNTVLSLDGMLQLSTINGYDTAEFTAVNVQVNSGSGYTSGPVNGLGNLTVGYNETSINAFEFCSDPQYDNSADCTANAEIWDNNVRRGSHNLIVGESNSYDDYGSFVAGSFNIVNAEFASVSGGRNSTASGFSSNVSGGHGNIASGGISNVSGGIGNKASGLSSSVSGGFGNTASGESSSVSGGQYNSAGGYNSSVSGGRFNTAIGFSSSVSGGDNRTAQGDLDWAAGSLFEDN